MKRTLFALFAVALLLCTSPLFAFCRTCGDDSICHGSPGSGTFCQQHIDYCTETGGCVGFADNADLSSDYAVASVEVKRPSAPAERTAPADARVATASLAPSTQSSTR